MVPLDSLVEDAGTQVRATTDDGVVDDYAEALANGARFPPIIVVRTNMGDILADGFHRAAAYRKLGRTEIEAEVHKGTVEDAIWLALGANHRHGQRLSSSDKRRAIEIAYRRWPQLSQRRITAQIGCSQPYVSEIHGQLKATHELPETGVGADGRRRPARRKRARGHRRSGPAGTRAGTTTATTPTEGAATGTTTEEPPEERSNLIVSTIAYRAKTNTWQGERIDFSALDFDQVPEWIKDMKKGAARLKKLSKRLAKKLKKNAAARARTRK